MSFEKKTVCVVGLGYIGLPTAALLANSNYKVLGVDINNKVVETINKGEIHIVEPELDQYVKSAILSRTLTASLTPCYADVFIIAVPTPFKDGYQPDTSYVESAAKAIAPYVKANDIIILESTSPVGTTQVLFDILAENKAPVSELYIAYCPERVLPGKIMKELVENDRIVGGLTPESTVIVKQFYKTFVKGEVLETDAKTAEMCKLVENSYRDVNIAFANELSMICEKAQINVWDLINLANHHPRVNILQPGAGVGGHCIAVDPWFIVAQFPEFANIIKMARLVNDRKKDWVIDKIKQEAAEFEIINGRKPKIVCMGLAFKPDIDDLRESPALAIANSLSNGSFDIITVEPNISLNPEVLNLVSLSEALRVGDIYCFLVNHTLFKGIEFNRNVKLLDFCGIGF